MQKMEPLKEYFQYPVTCIVIENVLSHKECLQWISDSEKVGYNPAMIRASPDGQQVLDTEMRKNDRAYIDNDIEKLSLLWDRVSPHFPDTDTDTYGTPIELNSRLRFLRYGPGNYFKAHYDQNVIMPEGKVSYWTLQAYLNDDFEGGNLVFLELPGNKSVKIKPKEGSVVLFDQELLHKADEVESGVKYAVRTDVIFVNQEQV